MILPMLCVYAILGYFVCPISTSHLVPDLQTSNRMANENNVKKRDNYVLTLSGFAQQASLMNNAKRSACLIDYQGNNQSGDSLIESHNLLYSDRSLPLQPAIKDALARASGNIVPDQHYMDQMVSLPHLNETVGKNITLYHERISSSAEIIDISVNKVNLTFEKPFDQVLVSKESSTNVNYLVMTQLSSDVRIGRVNDSNLDVDIYVKSLSNNDYDLVLLVPNKKQINDTKILMNKLEELLNEKSKNYIEGYRNASHSTQPMNFSMPVMDYVSIHNTYKQIGKNVVSCLKSLDNLYENSTVKLSHLLQVTRVSTHVTHESGEYYTIPMGIEISQPYIYLVINKRNERIVMRGRYMHAPKNELKLLKNTHDEHYEKK